MTAFTVKDFQNKTSIFNFSGYKEGSLNPIITSKKNDRQLVNDPQKTIKTPSCSVTIPAQKI